MRDRKGISMAPVSDSGIEKAVINEAQRLFDVAGVVSLSGWSLLVLGLLTTSQRDLDDFFRDNDGDFSMRGFERHTLPRLAAMVRFLQGKGVQAEILGLRGYPRGDELNLKQMAIIAGLGKWGKNSLVIHPDFGPWLRFMAIRVQTPLTPTGPGSDYHEQSPFCENCTACLDACPSSVLMPYYLWDGPNCRASVSLFPQAGKLVACDRCLAACPVGR